MRGKKLWIAANAVGLGIVAGAALADQSTMKSDQPVTDSYITTKVKAELAKDSTTKARHIHVTTKDGVVMLKGNVNSDAEKQKAEQDASGVKGVSHVENDLTVKTM
jgi:hyperosmotically inducible periplasmic protein